MSRKDVSGGKPRGGNASFAGRKPAAGRKTSADGQREKSASAGCEKSGGSEKSAGRQASGGFMPFPFPPDELLEKGLEALGIPESDSVYGTAGTLRGRSSIIPLVKRYIRELELFNAVFDLVGAETGSEQGRADLVVRHILDSLSPWKEIANLASALSSSVVPSRAAEVADAGSGAGFPGIPLAIVFPDIRFTLVERMSKRCAFLENCAAILGLKNVIVLNSEVEKAPAGRFDIVVFRAFRPLDREMTKTLLRLVRAPEGGGLGGKLAAWKAKRDKIEAEMKAVAEELDGWEIYPVPVPFLDHEERNLVVTSSGQNPSRPR